jgi:malonate-semialdehyde dehydrogenase (acetylating)/methylmalonate-semialdehyde dehydrogenase
MEVKKLSYFVGGRWLNSASNRYMDVYNPSTGEIIAQTPACTAEEAASAVAAAKKAFPSWAATPILKRVQVLYKLRDLIIAHLDELTDILCHENGKSWNEGKGDLMKVLEPIEFACGAPSLIMGESLLDTSTDIDTTLYREPLGVFVGMAPFNFPGMIPMGWMAPLCIATGNTFVLKAASMTPMTSMRLAELMQKAELPDGVVNIITCNRDVVNILLDHPDVKGVSFVGSTTVGREVYRRAAASGKRVQALCEAKNHALVLEDAVLDQTARGIVNSAFGCAGERCMALPVVVVQESIADRLISLVTQYAQELKIGPAYEKSTDLGPLISAEHKKSVLAWIEKGLTEGAKIVLDGRTTIVKGYEKGFYIGPTILDHVKSGMAVGDSEIFGPVLCFKRAANFEEGLALMNGNPFANGSVIFTQSGYYSREFVRRTDGGMVGINVGIPVPVGLFPFSGHKLSFFGDLHVLGKDGIKFFTETKCVTTRWFKPGSASGKVDTWDGTILNRS